MRTIAVVATPHVGTLDSWLPVVVEAREQHPDWRILMVLPRPERVARTLNPEDAALNALEEISDGILALGIDGRLYLLQTLEQVVSLSRSQWRSGRRIANLPLLRGRIIELEPRSGESSGSGRAHRLFRGLVRLLFSVRYRRYHAPAALVDSLPRSVVCTDVTKIGRGAVAVAMEAFGQAPLLSIEHGLGQGVVRDDLVPASAEELVRIGARTENLRAAYCYSEQMARAMELRFGIGPDRLVVSGIPRHDGQADAWRRRVARGVKYARPVVAVISHTTTSGGLSPTSDTDFLPARFKQQMLREVHGFCLTIGATMLVRLHPSEVRTESLREIAEALPSDGSDGSWAITSAHSSEMAASARLAVTFSSALKVEFVAFGVPVIDLSPGPPVPVCPEALAGLAIISHDVPSLRAALRGIEADRDGVLRDQRAAYRSRLADPSGSVARILRDVEESFPV